jgi:hypothetical protein
MKTSHGWISYVQSWKEILTDIETTEHYREWSLTREDPRDQEAALQAMSKLAGFIQDSTVMLSWACNPEPVFANAVWSLRKLNGLWAQNLASQIMKWYHPPTII